MQDQHMPSMCLQHAGSKPFALLSLLHSCIGPPSTYPGKPSVCISSTVLPVMLGLHSLLQNNSGLRQTLQPCNLLGQMTSPMYHTHFSEVIPSLTMDRNQSLCAKYDLLL